MTLAETVAVVKKLEAAEPEALQAAEAIIATFGPELAATHPKVAGDVQKATDVLNFLSKSNASLLAGFDKGIAFLTQLEAAL